MWSRPAIRVGLLLLLIFVVGGLTGAMVGPRLVSAQGEAAGGGRLQRGSPEMQARILQELSSELNLTEEQRARVKELLAQNGGELMRHRRDFLEKQAELFNRMSSAVRTNLTAEQLPAYEERMKRAKAKQQRMMRRLEAME